MHCRRRLPLRPRGSVVHRYFMAIDRMGAERAVTHATPAVSVLSGFKGVGCGTPKSGNPRGPPGNRAHPAASQAAGGLGNPQETRVGSTNAPERSVGPPSVRIRSGPPLSSQRAATPCIRLRRAALTPGDRGLRRRVGLQTAVVQRTASNCRETSWACPERGASAAQRPVGNSNGLCRRS